MYWANKSHTSQVGEKWRFDDYSYLCKGLFVRVGKIKVIFIVGGS
jgi:hypothetical protein